MFFKSKFFFVFIVLFLLFFNIEILFLLKNKTLTVEQIKQKKLFTHFVGLPDLAFSTEATYIRHRSLSDFFSIYKDDGSLREYMPTTYTIAPSRIEYYENEI